MFSEPPGSHFRVAVRAIDTTSLLVGLIRLACQRRLVMRSGMRHRFGQYVIASFPDRFGAGGWLEVYRNGEFIATKIADGDYWPPALLPIRAEVERVLALEIAAGWPSNPSVPSVTSSEGLT